MPDADDRLSCGDCGAEIRFVAICLDHIVDEYQIPDTTFMPWKDNSEQRRREYDEIELAPACDCAVYDPESRTAPEAWREDA